jgi:predicted  nucleic acid-binding Zn-ribbon protein
MMEGGEMADNTLESRVDRLEAVLLRLLEVQVASQEGILTLAQAQRRTEERLEQLVARLVEFVQRMAQVEEQIAQLTARVDDLTQRMAQVEAQIAQLTQRMAQLTARVDDLTQRMAQVEAQIAQLTQRMAQLTARVDDLTQRMERVEEQIAQLTQRMAQLTARVDDLTQRMAQVEAQIAQLTQRMAQVEAQIARLTDRMSSLTGMMLESRYRERAHIYFNRVLRRVRVLSPDTLDRLLEGAEESGRLTPAESEDVRATDVLALGRRREDESEAYLAVEVSGLVEVDDVARALRRAELLARATGKAAVPVVAGERISPEIDRIARESGVWRVLDGVALSPDTELPSALR